LLRLYGPDSSQPYGRLKLSTPELRAQLNLTNDHKKKSDQTCKHVLLPDHVAKKGEAQYCGQLFNKSTSTGETRRNGQLFHFT